MSATAPDRPNREHRERRDDERQRSKPQRPEARSAKSQPQAFSDVVELIREDYRTYWKDATKPGFKAMVVYRLNSWRASIPNRALRLPLSLVLGAAFRWIRNHYGIELPHSAVIGRRFTIIHQGGIVIHRYATIGDDCQILHGATLGDGGKMTRECAPVVGNGVQIGAGAMIIGRVTIGDGAKIGPNAVILSDVPPGATAFATPARIIFPPQPAGPVEAVSDPSDAT